VEVLSSPCWVERIQTGMSETEATIRAILLDRPVFVTGAAGFVGSHLTRTLVAMGARVHVFIRATSSGIMHNLLPVRDLITVHRGDLADKQAVKQALRKLKLEGSKPVIFHLGGQAHVGESWDRPYETVYTNVLGTINLLQSVVDLELDCLAIDVAGSSEEYGNIREDMLGQYRFDTITGGLLLDERSPINPQSVYGTSKVAEDFLARNYHKAYQLPVVVTRMFNNYGPRQSPRFITGTIITQALSRDIIQLGYVLSKRDFCYVADGVRGHIHAALFGKPGDVYVYGSGNTISMRDWANLIIKVGESTGFWASAKVLHANTEGRGRLGNSEVDELRVDYSKLSKLTGWQPEYSWEEGIALTIEWFALNRERWVGRTDWK